MAGARTLVLSAVLEVNKADGVRGAGAFACLQIRNGRIEIRTSAEGITGWNRCTVALVYDQREPSIVGNARELD